MVASVNLDENRLCWRDVGRAEPDRSCASKGGRSQKALSGLGAVLEPPARVAGLDDIAMVREAVQHPGRHLGVVENLRPVGEAPGAQCRRDTGHAS